MSKPDFQSVPEMFLWRVAETPDIRAFSKPDGEGWKDYTWKQMGELVRDTACGLRLIGLDLEDRVAILSGTRLEWVIADLGILLAGCATTTIYPASKPDECAYILNNSDSRVVFCESEDQVKKIMSVRGELPHLKRIIVFDGAGTDDGFVVQFSKLMKDGLEEWQRDRDTYEKVARSVNREMLATLIYTSGTTGTPKGVELTQDNWLYEGECIDALGLMAPDDVHFLWLPLAHSFGKVLEMAQIRIGFATAIDGRIEKIVDNLGHVKPTFMCGVPRIFEKVYNRVLGKAKEDGGMTWRVFQWALGVGYEASKVRQGGGEPGGLLGLKFSIADRLVFQKVRARFGGRIRFMISGSAPLSRDMAEFFHAVGLLILEGYGLTETSAATCVNRPDKYKFGTVGKALPGSEIKIAESDGEILIKGRGVMRGYRRMPEANAEVLKDGWFHSGDIGEKDADGYVRITDRKKDLIKTSGGKYVAPQAIEGKIKAISPYISQMVVHGDNRNFCTALIALDPESITKWAKENAVDGGYEAITQNPKTVEMVQGVIDQLNKELPSYETIKRFAVLPKDLTVEDGELTASQKLKRKFVEKKYIALLDGFYAGALDK